MKAAIWTDYGKMKVLEIETPRPQKGEVLIRISAAGLCTTDYHMYTGRIALAKPPHIIGHEIAGRIEQAGEGVDQALLGQRVVVETSIGCGHCPACLSGKRHLCVSMAEIGYPPHPGGYAEYVCVPAENAIPLPSVISDAEGGILESVVCPIGSLIRHGVTKGNTVAVFGAGPAGIAFIQGAKALGADKIIAIERNQARLERASRFGANVLLPADTEEIREHILEETAGQGVDFVCEAAGTAETIAASFRIVKKAGKIILYGVPPAQAIIPFPVTQMITDQLQVFGTVGDVNAWAPVMQMVVDGKINIRSMVTHKITIDEIIEGFEIMKNDRDNALKVVMIS